MDFSKIKVVVFDLDGTLYEDTYHFDYYADRLRDRLDKEVWHLFDKDYSLAKEDVHILRIGRH